MESFRQPALDAFLTPKYARKINQLYAILQRTNLWNLVFLKAPESNPSWTQGKILIFTGIIAHLIQGHTWVTKRLVPMLSQSQKTSKGLSGLKLSSNFTLPVAWIIYRACHGPQLNMLTITSQKFTTLNSTI